jgi:flagellar protein FlbD
MIKLTKLDGSKIYLNSDQIELIEETPDTHIILVNGNRYLVLEKSLEIVEKVVVFKSRIIHRAEARRKQSCRNKLCKEIHPLAYNLEGQERR